MAELTAVREAGLDKQQTKGDSARYLSTEDLDRFGALLNKSRAGEKATNNGQNVLPDLEIHDDTKVNKCVSVKEETIARCGKPTGKGDEIEISRPMVKESDEIPITRPMLKEKGGENHVLKPNDDGLVRKMVEDQTEALSLSPKAQKALKEALDTVANSNSQASLDKLGQLLPELFTVDGGKARTGFENALKELGYTVNASGPEGSKQGFLAAKHYTMDISEPQNGSIGGAKIKVDYKVGAGLEAEPEVTADKYFKKATF